MMVFLAKGVVGFPWMVQQRDTFKVSAVSIPLHAPDMRTSEADLYHMAGWALFAWARLKGWDG